MTAFTIIHFTCQKSIHVPKILLSSMPMKAPLSADSTGRQWNCIANSLRLANIIPTAAIIVNYAHGLIGTVC